VDTSGTFTQGELERVAKIAETFMYVVSQYDKEAPVSTFQAFTAILLAGEMAAMHSNDRELYTEMLKQAIDGKLIKLMSIDHVEGNA
jgi:hypothetical protein